MYILLTPFGECFMETLPILMQNVLNSVNKVKYVKRC